MKSASAAWVSSGSAALCRAEIGQQIFGPVIALKGVSLHVEARRGALPAWRQRRRQVDADQGAGRACTRPTRAATWSTTGRCASPRRKEALDLGIATVYQDLALVPLMSVARNFFMGREPWRRRSARSRYGPRLGSRAGDREDRRDGHPRARCRPDGRHDVRRREAVPGDRARDLFRREVLILDEPTSALGVKQASTCPS